MDEQVCCEHQGDDQRGLVVALCPDISALDRLNTLIVPTLPVAEAVGRLACAATLPTAQIAGGAAGHAIGYWRISYLSYDGRDDDFSATFKGEPLIEAGFACLKAMPEGGVPWQGSWRRNPLKVVRQTLLDGGVILVVAAHSFREQHDWARALLQSQCVFVQVHHPHENLLRIH